MQRMHPSKRRKIARAVSLIAWGLTGAVAAFALVALCPVAGAFAVLGVLVSAEFKSVWDV